MFIFQVIKSFSIDIVPVFSPSASDDIPTPAAVAESAMKVLNSCLSSMPTGLFPHSGHTVALKQWSLSRFTLKPLIMYSNIVLSSSSFKKPTLPF